MLGAALLLGVPGKGQSTQTLTMTARLMQSPCAVNVDRTDGTYTLASVKAPDIWGAAGYIQPSTQKITVTLSGCGAGDASTAPVLTMSGDKPLVADLKTPGANTFRDQGTAGGTAKEFFIGVAKKATVTAWPADFYSSGDSIAFTTTTTGSLVAKGGTGEGAKAEVWAGVASGLPGTTSDKSKARAGSVNATLTFTMTYK
ncbi:hypothetical protein ENT52713_46110 [Enterobacter sp. 200527-13]|nr:hypothetical protein ENT52713_46110 [Enterobacter sp. 200527-13]